MGVTKPLRVALLYAEVPIAYLRLFALRVAYFFAPDFVIGRIRDWSSKMNNGKKGPMEIESAEDAQFMFTDEMVWARLKTGLLNLNKEAQLGGSAPNTRLVNLEDSREVSLLDFASTGRMLVLNFGSCT